MVQFKASEIGQKLHYEKFNFSIPVINFTPKSRQESLSPKYRDQKCVGVDCVDDKNIIWGINLIA